MTLPEIISRKAIVPSLKARTKEEAIEALVDVLIRAKDLPAPSRDEVIRAVLKRERLGSTGIGSGLAVPHVKQSPHVPKVMGAFGRVVDGIEFGAIDGEPVHLIFLLLSPEGDPSVHLEALKMLSNLTRDENFCKFLLAARGVEEILETLSEVGGASRR